MPGTITFEWLEGGHFLLLRSHNDHELFPDSIFVIGAPEAGDGRFSATLARDAFEGLWQLARTPGDWQDDLKMTYRRRG